MAISIVKDIHEKLDYVFVRSIDEDIIYVTYELENSSSLVIESCTTNPSEMSDEEGNVYPANRLILLWVSGGTIGETSDVRITYHTSGGRILDADVTFRFVERD